MKRSVLLQYEGNDYEIADLERRVKDEWKADGNKVKDIKSLALYVKPEEGLVYYVVNELVTGSLPLES